MASRRTLLILALVLGTAIVIGCWPFNLRLFLSFENTFAMLFSLAHSLAVLTGLYLFTLVLFPRLGSRRMYPIVISGSLIFAAEGIAVATQYRFIEHTALIVSESCLRLIPVVLAWSWAAGWAPEARRWSTFAVIPQSLLALIYGMSVSFLIRNPPRTPNIFGGPPLPVLAKPWFYTTCGVGMLLFVSLLAMSFGLFRPQPRRLISLGFVVAVLYLIRALVEWIWQERAAAELMMEPTMTIDFVLKSLLFDLALIAAITVALIELSARPRPGQTA
jgi:hypothetical protein